MSGLVSLTLTPMMCGHLLSHSGARQREGRFASALETIYQRSLDLYAVCLRWSLHHRLFIMVVMAGTLAGTVYLYILIPKGVFPQQDNGLIQGTTEAGQDISYAAMVDRVHELAKVVMADPDVDTVYYWVGANPTVNTGRPRQQRWRLARTQRLTSKRRAERPARSACARGGFRSTNGLQQQSQGVVWAFRHLITMMWMMRSHWHGNEARSLI